MAWRPYQNLIDGELDNRTPGKVTGWIRFFRRGKQPLRARFDLDGDFHEDIRGKVIRFSNSSPSDRNEELGREGTYMDGLAIEQRGEVGDITAGLSLGPWTPQLAQKLLAEREAVWNENGVPEDEQRAYRREFAELSRKRIASGELYYPYVAYPYIERYSDNGRVVLELEPSQVEVIGGDAAGEKTPKELAAGRIRREEAFVNFMGKMAKEFSEENNRIGATESASGLS